MREENAKKIKRVLFYVGLFLVYLLMQSKYINDAWFQSDELDIFLIGKGLNQGKLLYHDMISQHMPVSYYISGFFYKLGAMTVTSQRVAFYILKAGLWTMAVYLYGKKINRVALAIHPFILCCMLQNYDCGTTILSEHLAGCGAIFLLAEFLVFLQDRKIGLRSYIIISLSVLLTFGTIFIAIYPVFFLAVGVGCSEIKWLVLEKQKFGKWFFNMLKKYGILILAVVAPWVVFLIYFLTTKSLGDFIMGAYTMNRLYYPKYNSGLGSSALVTFFEPIQKLAQFVTDGMAISSLSYVSILQWIFILAAIVFVYKLIIKDGIIAGGTVLLLTFGFGIRGIFNFHGTACVEVLAFMVSYVICEYGVRNLVHFKSLTTAKQFVLVMTIVIIAGSYFQNVQNILIPFTTPGNVYYPEAVGAIDAITEKDELIWNMTLQNAITMEVDCNVQGIASTTPWTWEAVGHEQFQALKENPPRVVVYTDGYEVWGYAMAEYASEVVTFVQENYIILPGFDNIYVRKDYYAEACQKAGIME